MRHRIVRIVVLGLILLALAAPAFAQYGDGDVMANRAWDDLYAFVWFKLCALGAWGVAFAGAGVEYDGSSWG